MKKTLVIVDMQRYYVQENDYDKLLIRMIRKIRKTIKQENPIIVLEFKEDSTHYEPLDFTKSKTHPILLKTLKDKRLKHRLFFGLKDDLSGGAQVAGIVKNYDLPTNFELIGVNTHQCVMATAINLKNRKYNVFVNERYCGCACCKDDRENAYLTDELLVQRGIPVLNRQITKLLPISTFNTQEET